MSTTLRRADSILGRFLRAAANSLPFLILALGTAAALQAQSAADAHKRPQTGSYSLLYSFQCNSQDGEYPWAGLIQDSAGNLYGTTPFGGDYSYGTIFKLSPGGTETVLHSFAGSPSDASSPEYGSLTLDAAGNLYGTSAYGGEFDYGTVYELTPADTESVLYNFTGGLDGAEPFGGVARGGGNLLYGTTYIGGTYGDGVVFKLSLEGAESVLHNFDGTSGDGALPASNLTRDSAGNLYGTTTAGGYSDAGTVFEVNASDAESIVYSFKGDPDGESPFGGGLLTDTAGNLYGATTRGGADENGVLFKLSSEGAEDVLLSFNGPTGGGAPIDGLTRDTAGNLYGTTQWGGSGAGCPGRQGCGVLFELTTGGTERVLHAFRLGSSSDGANPLGGVIVGRSGNLYGTLSEGGAYGCGAVFKYTP
jgi:uncharacterized repeat protein (TIGR03803 family)